MRPDHIASTVEEKRDQIDFLKGIKPEISLL
jgi:hypothetical protein